MTDTRGTFRLKEVRQDILNDEYISIPSVWTDQRSSIPGDIGYGHFMPGSLLKYNVTTTTVSTTGNSTSRYDTSGGGGRVHAYWAGGGSTSNNSIVSKQVYSTEAYTSQVGSLPVGGYGIGVITDDTAVRLVGGYSPATSATSIMQKITLATDGVAQQPSGNYPQIQYGQMSFNGAGANGYFWGGSWNPTNSKVVKLTFASDTHSYIPSSMLIGANGPGTPGYAQLYDSVGKLGTTTAGYTAGGSAGGFPSISTALKFTYSNETLSYPSSCNLPRKLYHGLGFTAGEDTGLFNSGRNSPSQGATYYSDTHLLTFSTESWATQPSMNNPTAAPSPSLNTVYNGLSGTSGRDNMRGSAQEEANKRWSDGAASNPNTGYSYEGGYGDTCYKTDLSTDTAANTPSAEQSVDKYYQAAVSDTDYGWISGGRSESDNYESITDRTTYSTDTLARLPGSNLPRGLRQHSSICNGTAGWFMGGRVPNTNTIYYKLAFSTNTMSSPSAQMAAANYGFSSTNSLTAGYGAGGHNNYTNVEKLVFSTESPSSLPSGLPQHGNMYETAATGTQTAGYWAGGGPARTDVSKMTWATETASRLPTTGFLSSGRYGMLSLGNTTDAYWIGGNPGPARTIDKLDYSTDTSAVSPSLAPSPMKNTATTATYGARADGIPYAVPPTATPTASTTLTGPQGIKAEGYLIQGIQGPTTGSARSDSYKLNYTTDTWSSSANSIYTRKNAGATSTTTNAYIASGTIARVDGGNHGGNMDKYTYSTSTFSTIPGSDAGDIPGPGAANKQCAAGNQTQGYWAFGPAQSRCSKLTYSNETGSNLPNLPWNAKNALGVSMQTAGYYGSGDGFDDKYTSFVKITFSNDTYASYTGWFYTPGGFGARYRCGSSSSTKAYIVGGQNAPRCMDVTPWATNSTSNSPTTFLQSPGLYKAPGQGSNEAGYFTGGGNVGNNGTTTEKITYASDTTAIVPSAYFPTSISSGVNSYSTGGPNMNGLGTNSPNII